MTESKTYHKSILNWIDEITTMCKPESVHWVDGSEKEANELFGLMIENGSCIKLNPKKRENSYLFRSDPRDVARAEKRTFICSNVKDDAGPTNNWKNPRTMHHKLEKLFAGCMKGRTMYIIPFCMGPIGSPISKIGIQVTDSPYVVVSMRIMTRVRGDILKLLDSTHFFVPCLHSVGSPLKYGQEDVPWPCDPENTCIVHFPEERTIFSYGSGYGGNAMLGKKCLGLRISSVMARDEGWLAEHMLIACVESPEGEKTYVTGAFPSGCGKTNLAMIAPPQEMDGWKVTTIGDDIAWIKPDEEGVLHAINPENGFFGVAPGTSNETNANAMQSCKKNTIFTNVALTNDGDVWWEGMTENPPLHLIDWNGNDWTPESKRLAAHPNSRFTAPIQNCPSIDSEFDNPAGVPIKAIIYGSRRAQDIPLAFQAFSWTHGVYVGATMISEKTAAAEGTVGELVADPMGMTPFCGYNMGDYFHHHTKISNLTNEPPQVFHVNWFRQDEEGNFLWPGFRHNMRILRWIVERANGKALANESPLGWVPSFDDIDWRGLSFSKKQWNKLMKFDNDRFKKVSAQNEQFLQLFEHLPKEMIVEHEHLIGRLQGTDTYKMEIDVSISAKPKLCRGSNMSPMFRRNLRNVDQVVPLKIVPQY